MSGTRVSPFAALLRRHRLAAGLTQEALAERAGLSGEAVQKLERGVSHPQRETLTRLLRVLHLTAEEEGALRDAALAPRLPRSADQPSHTLPAPLTPFVGRQRELEELTTLLASARLLTLTGVGGCGKTRLALELARRVAPRYGDGVCLVELAPLADPALLPASVASALDVRETRGEPLAVTLGRALHAKHLLLLLDNCEHMLDACAPLAEALLQRCPHVHILATSREPIGIGGEAPRRVPSLSLPAPDATAPHLVGDAEAVQLFLDRAQTVQPAFRLTGQNAATVAELCRRLDGIPLALELAAAWTRLLSVEQLALRLDDRFRLLTGGSRTALPRQQTLRAAFDWSYELLGERERQLFGRLAVFAGGFTLEAAEAVCAGGGIERVDVLALLARLVDTSLVQTDERPDGDTRYRLLETVRQYARERLHLEGARSEEDAAVALRHAEYFLGLGEHAIQQADPGPGISTWKPGRLAGAIEADRDNLHGALLWLEGQPDIELALRLARPLAHYWYARGLAGEGNARLQRLFSLATASTSLEALTKTRMYLASFARIQGDYATARAHLEALEAQSRRSGDRTLLALVLVDLGMVLREEDALPAARARAEEGLSLWRELGDERHAAGALERLGSIAELQGDAAEARRCYEHYYQVARTHGARMEMGWALHELALLALGQGDAAAAKPPLRAGMETFQQLNYPLGLIWTLPLFACLAAMERRAGRALRLAGALETISTQAGLRLYRRQRHLLERWLPVARSTLGEEMAAAASTGGRALSLDQAVACALEEDDEA